MPMGSDLLAIIKDEETRAGERKQRLDCPICGNKLEVNARGERNCDVGHYRTGAST